MLGIPLTTGALKASLIGNAVLVLALVTSISIQQARVSNAQTEAAEARTALADQRAAIATQREDFQAQARAAEQAHVTRITEITTQYHQEQTHAQERTDRVVAELRAGERRLRQQWAAEVATAQLSATVAATAGADGSAADRAEAVGRVLRIGADADRRIRALQGVILSMQAGR